MKITIENLIFPSELFDSVKFKIALSKLKVKYLAGHIIKIHQTNLSLCDPHKIILNNGEYTLLAYIYNDSDKIAINKIV